MTQLATPIMFRKAGRMSIGRDRLLNLIEITLEPLLLPLTFWTIVVASHHGLGAQDVILGVIVFALTFPGPARLSQSPLRAVRNILMGWIALAGLLAAFGYASGYLGYFDLSALVTWWWVAPVSQLSGHFLLRAGAPVLREMQGGATRAVVAGMNEQGVELARRLAGDVYSDARVVGFFDDRARERLAHGEEYPLLGNLAGLAHYVKNNHVDVIYLSLPMASQKRILSLLEELRDTTASIYFIPDIFVTELIQGRMDSVGGMPVVGVCDSPFVGMDGLLKRGSD
ncbi:MAG: undecaprenyl-phosphate glucose phosphotransferase, partial [Burkholderiales bacterium]